MKCKNCELLGLTLWNVLIAEGVVRKDMMISGPELICVAEEFIKHRNSQDNIERNNSADGKNKKVSLPCGEHNKSSFQFPNFSKLSVSFEMSRERILSIDERNLIERFYNFIVGNKKR